MKTEYTFQIVTFVVADRDLRLPTKRAEIVVPANGQQPLNRAIVTVERSPDSQNVAIEELQKFIVRHLGRGCSTLSGGAVTAVDVPETGEERSAVKVGALSYKADALIVTEYRENLPGTVKIDVDGDPLAACQFHRASTQSDPVDRFKEYFKVVEFYSGTKSSDPKDTARILACLGRTWDIPPSVWGPSASSSDLQEREAKEAIAHKLIELRGSASHLRPDYGLRPTDPVARQELSSWAPRMEEIASCSLELNTTKPSSSPLPGKKP